ncbi:DUF4872 domain-containing protein [Microbacterium wangchenii]|uniref:DUF4872 domain-containing protein n=2 Tax=Microbacteriaceae TaxID=85023 RepID=A0ABX5SV41_9MICO|nr:DUF4872 domain-containing protein [Microbacterium wangchenii]
MDRSSCVQYTVGQAHPTPNLLTGSPRGSAMRRQRGLREPRDTAGLVVDTERLHGLKRGRGSRGQPGNLVMTGQKQLKARIRERMARTGERYASARARFVTDSTVEADHGWALRGGTDPDASNLAKVLAHRGVVGVNGPLSEALLFGIAGGIGAGYILWEFQEHKEIHLVLGFGHSWNHLDRRAVPALSRLGVDADFTRTGGEKTASALLSRELAAGNPSIVWPDRYRIGYWNLPAHLDGHGGHPVVAYAETDGRVHLDDRNLHPLTVQRDMLDDARSRVGSYKNAMLAVRSRNVVLTADRVESAVLDGLSVVIDHLSSASTSFSLPAWQKWSKLIVDDKAKKGWPTVFAGGTDLLTGLAGTWDAIAPVNAAGGHLRGLFGDFLEEAGQVLRRPQIEAEASRWREIGDMWQDLADTALPQGDALFDDVRELTAGVAESLAQGDDGSEQRRDAALRRWKLFEANRDLPDYDSAATFEAMSVRLAEIFRAEAAGIARLRELHLSSH